MKINNEKGFSGVDITISIMILFIFVSLIAVLSYNYSDSSRKMELKTQATYYAIDEIEIIKNGGFNKYKSYQGIVLDDTNNPIENIPILDENNKETGYYKTIRIDDYSKENPNAIPGITKKATVTITYKYKNNIEKFELSTILTRES